jgi:cell division protein ZapE
MSDQRPLGATVLPGVTVATFERAADEQGFVLDDAQLDAIRRLSAPSEHGHYLWGRVGRGKTWIMDTAFDAIATPRKRRVHFHEFFQQLHRAIIRHHNSIERALDELLGDVDVLCFDEFHVHDVADSTFIRRMLLTLFDRPITLVVTSNYPPEGLLPDPLFHDTFLPTIALIADKLEVVQVRGTRDYRRDSEHRHGFASGSWVTVRGAATGSSPATVHAGGRPLTAMRADQDLLWFRFADLLEAPTATSDYLELAAQYPTWMISEIPDFTELLAQPAQRFANLVDVLYDKQIPTTFVAETPMSALADAPLKPLDVERVVSRLSQLRQGG